MIKRRLLLVYAIAVGTFAWSGIIGLVDVPNILNSRALPYATLGCVPGATALAGQVNRPGDRAADLPNNRTNEGRIPYPTAMERDVIADLFLKASYYQNNLSYYCYPQAFDDSYNSNSYAAGLLRAAGLELPNTFLEQNEFFPGLLKRLPEIDSTPH